MTAPEPADLARQRLYKERAEWAELESEIAEGKKYFTVGGWSWKIAEFLDREAKEARAEIQEEIDAMNKPHDQWDSRDIAEYGRMSMHVEEYDFGASEYRAHPEKRGPEGGLVILLAAGMIAVLVTLMIAHAVVRIVAGGW